MPRFLWTLDWPRTGRVLLALQDGDVLVYATTRGKSKARGFASALERLDLGPCQ